MFLEQGREKGCRRLKEFGLELRRKGLSSIPSKSLSLMPRKGLLVSPRKSLSLMTRTEEEVTGRQMSTSTQKFAAETVNEDWTEEDLVAYLQES